MRYAQTRPPLGVAVDWNHSRTRGMVGCWLMNEGGGASVYNLCSPTRPLTSETGVAFARDGHGIVSSGADDEVVDIADANNIFMPHTGFTWAFKCIPSVSQAKYWIAKLNTADTSNMLRTTTAPDRWRMRVNSTEVVGGVNISLGVPQVVVVTYDGSTITLYVAHHAPVTGTVTHVANAQPFGLFGNRNTPSGSVAAGSIEWARVWQRPLTAAEALSLRLDPYGDIVSVSRRVWHTTTAVGSTFPGYYGYGGWS